jgi:hypothetical protein
MDRRPQETSGGFLALKGKEESFQGTASHVFHVSSVSCISCISQVSECPMLPGNRFVRLAYIHQVIAERLRKRGRSQFPSLFRHV